MVCFKILIFYDSENLVLNIITAFICYDNTSSEVSTNCRVTGLITWTHVSVLTAAMMIRTLSLANIFTLFILETLSYNQYC